MSRARETVRLQGRVRAVGPDEGKPVLEQVTVEVDGQSTSWTAPPREFDLVDESGQAVRIEVPREVQVEAAATRRSGAWSELHEACCPDPEDLAAPFAKAKLVSRAIRAGDQVEVYGDRRSGRRGRGGLQRQPAAARPHGLRSDHPPRHLASLPRGHRQVTILHGEGRRGPAASLNGARSSPRM